LKRWVVLTTTTARSGSGSGIVSDVSTVVEFRGSFRLVEEDANRLRRGGKGKWYCRCGGMADAVHENPKCEDCRSGGDCGLDCTLTSLYCPTCGAKL
jgi:hypothetical protein